ncbi:FAD-dependent oxidoreductase [Streptosporangium carneum]|uniref:3-(3-hydroxyphenyl)propionate hydroxylase n=1 Tax=Streptosporangium carneum TaxID=47481 RepID=A0A9W6IAF5_9ACTN|nr:FAD-dependent oxidoreductase [Streptosporangium carneum]GLK14421.1 3-(3-hydroxyphenyl)propionate hydroxylase [Streptosporangium carneum]
MNGTQVIIVGAGPTGLTLAVDLARRGVDFRIVERSPRHPAGSRGKGLQPRTQEVFDDLGVAEEILATGRVYPPIRAYAGERVVWEGRMHEPREPEAAVPYPMVLMQPQWRTERILRDRLAALGRHVELGVEVTAFEQDDDGVTVTLGGAERVRCDYLVGADGGRSSVRKGLGVGFEGETSETERMVLGDVRATGLDHEHWHTWADMATRTMRVALCPLPGTDVFQFTAPFTGEEAPELSLESFQRILDEGSGRTDIRLTEVAWTSLYRVNVRMAERFRVGRVFLAGDAAHVHSPAGGQGLNTGVQDAYNLGWKLAAVLGGAPGRLLDTYEEERLPVAADVLGISTRLYGRAKRGEEGAHARDEETQQLLLGYREGSLAVGERGGERAPDATLGGGRLFDVLRGPHFTLLALGAADAGPVEEVNARYGAAVRAHTVAPGGGTGDLVDVDGLLHEHYGKGLVLIRPDGYVGYHGGEAGLRDYLAAVTAG